MMMAERLSLLLHATDGISRAGVAAALGPRQEVRFVSVDEARPDAVAMVVTDRTDARSSQVLRELRYRGFTKLVLVASEFDDAELLTAIEIGVCGVLRRAEATPEALLRLVQAAAGGESNLPPELLGRLIQRVSRLHRPGSRRGGAITGMTPRETEVLRMVADGLDTREISERLNYSQRTVKSILHDIISRFQLRNRPHAVAFALREGLI
ncbi:response regulator transcription factor [Allokutzneria albata]